MTGFHESATAQELFIGAVVTRTGLEPGYLFDAIQDEQIKTDLRTEVDRLGHVLWPSSLTEERKRDYPSVTAASLLVRLFSTGVATCTLRLDLQSSDEVPVRDVQLDNLLKCLDPRRRTAPSETLIGAPPPDLTKILSGLLAAISTEASNTFRNSGSDKESEHDHAPFPDIGSILRARVNWTPESLPHWARPEIEQLPYCTLDIEMGESPFWETNETATVLQRRLFHLMAGTYLRLDSETLRVPLTLRSPDENERLQSLTWSTDSFVLGTARGSIILFRSRNGGEWPEKPDVITAYRQSTIDAIEGMIGVWIALGLLNVSVDQAIQGLTLEPRENVEPLKHLATARHIFARLLSEPMFYQAEGSTVRAISKLMRHELGIIDLREALLKKLSEVRDLHDLLLHLNALRQIEAERGK